MKLLADFFPIIVFFIFYKLYGIYVATAAAIIVSILQMGVYWFKHRKFETMQVTTLILIVVLGGATLLLHDPIFIKWKVSVVYWLFAIIFLGSHFFGKEPMMQRLMKKNIQLPALVWRKMSWGWAGFFIIIGIINLYVAYHFDTNAWVYFKLFGVLGLTLIFVIIQAIFLAKHIQEPKNDSHP